MDRYSYAYYPLSVRILSGLFVVPLAIPFAILVYAKAPLIESLGYLACAIAAEAWVYRTLLYQGSDIALDDNGFRRYLTSGEWLSVSWSDIESVRMSSRVTGPGLTTRLYRIRIRPDATPANGKRRVKIQADMVRRVVFNEDFERHLRDNSIDVSTY